MDGLSTTRPWKQLQRLLLAALVLVGVIAAVTAPARAATSPSVHVAGSFFGMQDESTKAYDHLTYGSLRLWDAHVTWRDIETSPGLYSWTHLDALVTAARAHCVQVTLVLAVTPAFYGPAASLPPTDVQHYRDFVTAVMTRYRDFTGARGIATYQVWNEGNVPYFWTGTPAQLAELTQVVWQVRQSVDPAATLLAPSFAVRLSSQRQWFYQYLTQQVDGQPVWTFYDATALSLYPRATYGDRIGGPEDAMRLLAQSRKQLAAAGSPASKPLWVTEINYGVTGNAVTPLSEKAQVANVMRTYLLGASRGVARLFWYRYDWGLLPASRGGGSLGNTLLSVPGSPDQVTAAGLAVGTVEAWLKGRLVTTTGRTPCAKDSTGTYTCVVRYSGGTRTIMWNPDHSVRVPTPRGATSLQSSRGTTTTLTRARATMRVSYLPVMVSSPR